MGTSTTPRHRAETSPSAFWGDLRRAAARVIAGRDLYADDAILRPAVAQASSITPAPTAPDNRKGTTVVGGAYTGLSEPYALG